MRVVGIDGCRGGWVGVVLSEHVAAVTGPTIASILAEVGPVEAVAIDIPIGLPVGRPRVADVTAQRVLGARRSTVFATPIRESLEAPTLGEAIALSRARTGTGISAQAYALRSRILEVAAWLPGAGVDVREVHPEVSFAVLSGQPMASSKRTWNGIREREAALATAGIRLPDRLGRAGSLAGVDDVLDAAVAAWTARRVARAEAISFPSPPEDVDGWATAIWA